MGKEQKPNFWKQDFQGLPPRNGLFNTFGIYLKFPDSTLTGSFQKLFYGGLY